LTMRISLVVTLLSASLLLLTGFFLDSTFAKVGSLPAGEVEKPTIKKAPAAKRQVKAAPKKKIIPAKIKPAAVIPVDLRVARIWLDGQCRVNYELKNTGKGPAQFQGARAFAGQTAHGQDPHGHDPEKIDPKGVLAKPGGKSIIKPS
jgi:hypothetical protein